MNQNKPFMTYEQQIMMLQDDKKLEIVDENYAMSLLKEFVILTVVLRQLWKGSTYTYLPGIQDYTRNTDTNSFK